MTLKRFGVHRIVRGQFVITVFLMISCKRKLNGNERVDFTSQMFNSIIPDHDEFNEDGKVENESDKKIDSYFQNKPTEPQSSLVSSPAPNIVFTINVNLPTGETNKTSLKDFEILDSTSKSLISEQEMKMKVNHLQNRRHLRK